MIEQLKVLCEAANKAAFKWCGHRSTCILTSAGLVHALRELGYDARPVRVRCFVGVREARHGTVLGSDGDGSRRPAAGKDMWHGHLAVIVNDRYLLDPTVDQAGVGDKWHRMIKIGPFTGEVSERFAKGLEGYSVDHGNSNLFYNVSHRQTGFLSAPDWKHKSHWRPVADAVLKKAKTLAKSATNGIH